MAAREDHILAVTGLLLSMMGAWALWLAFQTTP